MKNIFNKITFLFFVLFIVLSFKIINSNYYIDISNKESLNNIFNLTFNYKNIFSKIFNEINVNNNINYIKEDNGYISNSSLIFSIKEGIIYYNENKIIIKQNDDFDFVLIGKFNIFVFNGDYVDSGSIIGEYYEPFLLYLVKDNMNFTYEDYLRNYF